MYCILLYWKSRRNLLIDSSSGSPCNRACFYEPFSVCLRTGHFPTPIFPYWHAAVLDILHCHEQAMAVSLYDTFHTQHLIFHFRTSIVAFDFKSTRLQDFIQSRTAVMNWSFLYLDGEVVSSWDFRSVRAFSPALLCLSFLLKKNTDEMWISKQTKAAVGLISLRLAPTTCQACTFCESSCQSTTPCLPSR